MAINTQMSAAEKFANELEVDKFNKSIAVNGRTPSQELGKDDFLKLLMAQLSHQDPTEPMDNNQFIAQMAQFSSLEQMHNMSNGFNKLASLMNNSEASQVLGKVVSLDAGGTEIEGLVEGFTRGEKPQLRVNGELYDMDRVKAVYSN